MTRTATLLLALLAGAHAKGFPKITMNTFRGTLTVSANFTSNNQSRHPNTTDVETSVFAGDRKKLILMQSTNLPDGRPSVTITDFKGNALYAQTPFFNESVCYKLPIPMDDDASAGKVAAKPVANVAEKPDQAWYDQLLALMQLPSSPGQDTWHKNGTAVLTASHARSTLTPRPAAACRPCA